jgi:hypothetical protein
VRKRHNHTRLEELSKQLIEKQRDRDELATWIKHNVRSREWMDELQRYNALCSTCASLRTRIDNLRDGLPELGRSLPTQLTQYHKQTTK